MSRSWTMMPVLTARSADYCEPLISYRWFIRLVGRFLMPAGNRDSIGCFWTSNWVGLSGIDLRKRLPAEGDRTPAILITAHDDPETRQEALAAGCAAYFRKTDP